MSTFDFANAVLAVEGPITDDFWGNLILQGKNPYDEVGQLVEEALGSDQQAQNAREAVAILFGEDGYFATAPADSLWGNLAQQIDNNANHCAFRL